MASSFLSIGTPAHLTIDLLTKHQTAVRLRNRIADEYKMISLRETWLLSYQTKMKNLNNESMNKVYSLTQQLIKLNDLM